MAVSESSGSEELSIASAAMDLLVRAIARQHRVQRPVALCAVETFLVPHLEANMKTINRVILGPCPVLPYNSNGCKD